MRKAPPFLDPDELATLQQRRSVSASRLPFGLEIDAAPLACLAESAALGSRVYEFMSIRRPGDVLRYLWVHLWDIPDPVRQRLVDALHRNGGADIPPDGEPTSLPLANFDRALWRQELDWIDPDADDEVYAWARHRKSDDWSRLCTEVLALLNRLQARLRDRTDELLQDEIALIDARRHRRDMWPRVESVGTLDAPPSPKCSIPRGLLEALRSLVRQPDVRRVSCCWSDQAVWRMLVLEQIRRASAEGVAPDQALSLSGPDSGLLKVSAEDWGGEIHTPMEGVRRGDLLVVPRWMNFDRERAEEEQSVRGGLFEKALRHVVTDRPLGTFAKDSCQRFGKWYLYSPWDASLADGNARPEDRGPGNAAAPGRAGPAAV